jgi:hypothetical protein
MGPGGLAVHYSLSKKGRVDFRVFSIEGRLLVERKLGVKDAGNYTERLAVGSTEHAPQVYVLIMRVGNTAIRKVVVLAKG